MPKDSTVVVRSRSALGLKYLEINKGTSSEGYDEGSTLPLRVATPEPVEIDEFFNIFDAPTRQASQANLVAFGNALAGRGPDLNVALGELRPLVTRLVPVARNLASPKTGVGRFFRALADSAAEVAPVAETQAQMFVALESTFGAFARVARPYIQESISEAPPTFDTLIRTAPPNQELPGAQRHPVRRASPGHQGAERQLARRWRRRSRPAPTCCPAPRR